MTKETKNNVKHVGAGPMSAYGITLISLIITIIIMLILAGIVLNLTIGERGIFKTASDASKQYEIERIKEKVNLEIIDLASEKLSKGEKLTKEEALIEINKREIFEEIDLAENTGICEGYEILLGYDENGNVIILGIEKDREVRMQGKRIEAGYRSSFFIDENGRLIGTGQNSSKEMGIDNLPYITEPRIITEIKLKKISAYDHVLAIDENEELWSWGKNMTGQLGNGTIGGNMATTIKIKTEVKFKEISAGNGWSLAIDKNGELWSWGSRC